MGRTKEVIVVGAGPGGLASALLLAAQGLRVRILERLPHPGGRTSTFQTEGFTFDLGPTFFLYPRILEEIFSVLGRNLNSEVDLRRVDPNYRLIYGQGGVLDVSVNREDLKRQIAAIDPADAEALDAFLDAERVKLERFSPVLQQPFNSWRDLVKKQLIELLPLLHPHQSLESYLKRYFRNPQVRLAFCFQSKYLGMSPFRCPSLFSILSFLEHEYGVFHPIGGCGAITTAMAKVAEDAGVEIHLDEPVEEILFRGRKATGVRTSKGVYNADALVVNADFSRAMTSMAPNHLRRRWTDEKLEKKRYSCSTFMLYLGVEGQDDLPHHNIYISSDYDRNLNEIERGEVLSEDPSFYVQNAAVTDSSLAPKGQSGLYVLAPVPHQSPHIDWRRESSSYRERLLNQLEKAGFENVRSRIRYERMLTPQDWDTGYNIHLGATFNLAHNYGQMLHLRPRNRFEDLEGVYLVGGGTHPGSGLPVIFESARISSGLVCEDLGITSGASSPSEAAPVLNHPAPAPAPATAPVAAFRS